MDISAPSQLRAPSITRSLSVPIAALPLASIAGGLIAFLAAAYTVSFWSDVPYFDEWLSVPYAAEVATDNWALSDIFEPGQGHTGAAYRFMTIVSTKLLHYDPRLNMLAGFACLVASAIFLTSRYSSFAKTAPVMFVAVMVGVWASIFTLHNWENLLAAWLINSAATLLFALTALSLAERESKFAFALALLAALACALSFTNGQMIWPALALFLWLGDRKKRLIPLAVCAGLLFLWVIMTRDRLGSSINILNAPGRFLAELGTPFLFQHATVSLDGPLPPWAPTAAMILGAVTILCLVAVLASQTRMFRDYQAFQRMRFSLALTLYGLGSVAMIALGRSDLDVGQAMTSRYVGTTMLVYIGLLLMALEGHSVLAPRLIGLGAVGALVAAFLFAAWQEFGTGPYRAAYTANWRQVVLNYKTMTDAQLANPHHNPDSIRQWSATLEQLNLGPFARAAGSRPPEMEPAQ